MATRRKKQVAWPDIDVAVSQAMEIIAPEPDRRAECREDFEDRFATLVNRSTNEFWFAYPNTKRAKMAARDLGAALRRVVHAYNAAREDLDIEAREFFPIDEIKRWLDHCDADATRPAPRRALRQPEKLAVARLAAQFLRRYDRKVTVTRKGDLN